MFEPGLFNPPMPIEKTQRYADRYNNIYRIGAGMEGWVIFKNDEKMVEEYHERDTIDNFQDAIEHLDLAFGPYREIEDNV